MSNLCLKVLVRLLAVTIQGVCLYLTCSLHIGIYRIGMGPSPGSPGQEHEQVRKQTEEIGIRFVKGDYRTTSSVTQMLQELGWQDLQSGHRDLRLAVLL